MEALELCGSSESEEYLMNYKNRGKCYIFNHKVFDPHLKCKERRGTDADAIGLYCRFRDLGFDVKVFNDPTIKEVSHKLEEAGKEDHSDSSCFVCCILSHGGCGYLYAKDGIYPTESVFTPFRGDVCPSLVGKPKLFFIQACQGKQFDSGVNVIYKESTDQSDASNFSVTDFSQFTIPTHADFLIMYSTIPGYYSWRNPNCGSWFIQSLCETLEKHAKTKDINQILTIVNRKVAFNFESYKPDDLIMHKKKQMPLITSTLTRDLKFS